jgi:chemotaxis response regulator CheB
MYASRHHRRVLIVDDDLSIRQLLRLILEVEEFEVVGEATDGIQAVPQALELQPDVVVLDQQMPNRDGAATAEILRVSLPEALIIACSAIIESKPPWADAFLAKQNMSDVVPLVQGLIDLRED